MTIANIYGKPTRCRHGSKCWIHTNIFNSHIDPSGRLGKYHHFTDEETEAQRKTLG